MGDNTTSPRLEALSLLEQGLDTAEVAERVGKSERTVQRWRAEDRGNHAAAAKIEGALDACLPDGSPDWTTRLRAYRLLHRTPPPDAPSLGEEPLVNVRIRREGDRLIATNEATGETVEHEYALGELDGIAI